MDVLKELDDNNYQKPSCHSCTSCTSPRKLVDISAMVLVKDLRTIEQAVKCLPAELFEPLMRACVLGSHLLVSRQLVWSWPFQVLNFKKLLPQDDPESCEKLKSAFNEYEKCLGSIIVRTIAERKNDKLRVVDIRDFDIDQESTNLIGLFAAKPMLDKEQEHGGERLVRLAEKAIKRQPIKVSPPKDPLILHVDCVVKPENVDVVTLAMAIHHISPISLKCAKLHATSLGVMKLLPIIRCLDPQYCRGVNLSMNSLECSGVLNLLPDLKKLIKLEALGLSYNLLDLTRNYPVTERMLKGLSETLNTFQYLKRLDLSNNRIGGSLRRLVGSVKQPLQYLGLSSCHLTSSDIVYLATSTHPSTLCVLDLSGNNLANNPEALFTLIKNCTKTVQHLAMSKCQLHLISNIGTRLSYTCSNCEKLRILSLTENELNERECLAIIKECDHISTMENLYISTPIDHFDEYGLIIEGSGEDFYNQVDSLRVHCL